MYMRIYEINLRKIQFHTLYLKHRGLCLGVAVEISKYMQGLAR